MPELFRGSRGNIDLQVDALEKHWWKHLKTQRGMGAREGRSQTNIQHLFHWKETLILTRWQNLDSTCHERVQGLTSLCYRSLGTAPMCLLKCMCCCVRVSRPRSIWLTPSSLALSKPLGRFVCVYACMCVHACVCVCVCVSVDCLDFVEIFTW